MKHLLDIPFHLKLTRHPGQTVLNVQFEARALRDWCLGLCLLKEGLIQILLARQEGAKGKLEIQLTNEKDQARADASFEPDTTRLKVSVSDLDYLLHFFLKYYRDGLAEVDHIDLEVLSAIEAQGAYITFKVPEAASPLTAKAAKRQLGLN